MQLKRYSMHLPSILLLACLVINNSHVARADVIDDLVEIERVELHCPIILYASDFGTSGTTIDQPGYYILCGDVAWTAVDDSSAITTATSHVTIDLNNHAIYQTNKGSVSNVNGITINQNVHDVTIKNGTLSDFTRYGIRGIGDNENITIATMLIEDTGSRGIIFLPFGGFFGCAGLTITNCTVNGSAYQGLRLNSCSDVNVRSCSFIQGGGGVWADVSSKCRFIDCHFDNNTGSGALATDSQEILFDNCTFNKNVNKGLVFYQSTGICEGIIVQNCQAIGNTSDTSYAAGFAYGPISGVIFKNCIANLNESSIDNGIGFWLYETQGCRIEQCIAENNKGTQSYGIFVSDSSQDNLIIDCKTHSNNATTPALGYGIKVTSTTDQITIQDCEAFSNSGYGIYNDAATSIISGCVAGNNGTASFGGTNGATFARRNKLGNHFEIGEQENISVETQGINEVGYITYLDQDVFPLTISSPGHYILCEDLNFDSGSVTALSIESNFVTLDLNDKSISGMGLDTVITITPGSHDITIKNGAIAGFRSYGIFVDENCHHIDIENMHLSQADCIAAIQFNGASNAETHDCRLINCLITEIDTSRKVCSFNYCNDIQFIDCAINKNTRSNTVGPLEVVFLDHSNKCQFMNCQFNDNKVSYTLTVVLTTSSDSLLFDSCTFNNNGATSNYPLEIIKGGTSGSIIRNCLFLNNSGGGTTWCYCIDLESTATGNIIDSCRINSNTSASGELVGINLRGCANKVKQTEILSNNGNTCTGIKITGDYNMIDGCYLLSNVGLATGIKIESTADATVIKNCLIFANNPDGINNQGNNSVIVGCAAGNNTTDYTGADALSFYKLGDTSPQPVYEYDNVKFTL